MPQIPAPTTQTVFPSAPGGNYLNIQASPEAFGSQLAAREGQLGGQLDQTGNMLAEHAVKFQQQRNAADVSSADSMVYQPAVRDLAQKFYSLSGKDAVDGMNPTAQSMEEMRQRVRNGLANPEQQRMFDYISRQRQDQELYRMSQHAGAQNKEWMKQVSIGAINNEKNNSATYWNDDTQFANSMGAIKLHTIDLLKQEGIDPNSDAGQVMIKHFQGEAWQARLNSVSQQNPDVAREMFDQNADQIDAQHRSAIDVHISQQQWTFKYRQAMQEQHDQIHAEHEQKMAQQETFSMVFGDAIQGKYDANKVADMVRAQVITPEQANAAQNMATTAVQGKGHSPNEYQLWIDLASGHAGPTEIAQAIGHQGDGWVNAETGAMMGKFWAEKQQANLRLTDEQNWDAVSDSIGAKALSMGINLFGMDDKVHAQIISQARTEWTRRVIVGKEDSFKVASELRGKYAPLVSDPRMLARPIVGDQPQDRAGLQAAARATLDAYNEGRMDVGTYKEQAYLLNRYKELFDLQDKQQAAKPPPSMQKSGDKSKVLGLEPAK